MKLLKRLSLIQLCPLVLLPLVVAAIPRPAAATSVTQASVSDCVNADDQIVCENKMMISLEVSYGAGVTLQTQYIHTVTRAGGEVTTLEDPLLTRVVKSEPAWSYPLRYLHTVDYAPREELIKAANGRPGIAACLDGSDAPLPTCGRQLDGNGNPIADSQGFCSNRDLLSLKNCAPVDGWWRGEKELGVQSALASSFSIAHCLRESGVSYRGYEIDPPRRDYRIDVAVYDVVNNMQLRSQFSLTPDAPIFLDRTGDYPVRAELIGEAAPSEAPPELSGFILYVPTAPADDPQVVAWKDNMLLVPRSLVSRDGGACDRVGSGHAAFRRQGAAAGTTRAGACLANQLQQLRESDLDRLAANPAAETEYLLRGKKLFKEGLAAMTGLALRVATPELAYSTIGIEINNATVGLATNDAVGWIKETSANPYPSLSREGGMSVTVENVGTTTTNYLVTVTNCSPAIETVSPRSLTVTAGASETLNFPLRSSSDMAGSHYCYLYLTNPITARVYDSAQVFFNTTAVSDKAPREWLLKNGNTTVKAP